jgi:peptide chain release factor subunit 1
MVDLKRKRFEKLIKELGEIKGRHTELVTFYVPAGFNLNKAVDQLRQEQSTAQNIKSKAVRKNVMAALEKILQHLKLYKKTPEKGLVLFCGNTSRKEGSADIELFSIEPLEPVGTKLYQCGQNFIVEPLKSMVEEKEVYGLVVLDKSEADIGLLKGKKVESLKHMESIVPGKTKKGGWSSNRFARVREGLLEDFLKNVGDIASKEFRERKLKGVIIGGPGPIKEQFYSGEHLHYEVKKKVLGLINTSYTGEYGLNEMIDRADDVISEASAVKEKNLLERFFTELGKDSGLAVYGLEETMKALKNGIVEIILISESFDYRKTSFECPECKNKEERIIDEKFLEQECSKCKSMMKATSKEEIIERIIEDAENMGTKVEMISKDTPKGEQLIELGSIGGILRYKA